MRMNIWDEYRNARNDFAKQIANRAEVLTCIIEAVAEVDNTKINDIIISATIDNELHEFTYWDFCKFIQCPHYIGAFHDAQIVDGDFYIFVEFKHV